jgi:hypothetical protein
MISSIGRSGSHKGFRGQLARRALAIFLLGQCLVVTGEVVENGYFADTDVQPLRGASMNVFGSEPAAVIVFSSDGEGIEAAAKFDAWARQSHMYDFPRFGVVIGAPDETTDILEEVLTQKDVKMPVFYTRAKLLHGGKFRILAIDRGEAQDHGSLDFGSLETKMNSLADAAKKAPGTPTPVDSAVPTAATPTPASTKRLEYANTRYSFVVQFPPGWTYKAARNGDGAVGQAPTTSTLDVRVWAVPKSQASGVSGETGVPDFVIAHLETLGKRAGTEVNIERKFIVREGEFEGRDYLYSYPEKAAGGEGSKAQTRRGRIQAFDADGVYKVASAEGESAEFERNRSVIDAFLESFSVAPE